MKRAVFILTLLFLSPFAEALGRTGLWLTGSYEEFQASERAGVALSEEGPVTLGRQLSLLADPGVSYVWDLASGPDGSVYAATGSEGKVFRIGPDGKSTLLAAMAETQALSVAVGRGGEVYVGLNSGEIYRIGPDGKVGRLFDTGEDYVWRLVVAKDGSLLAATGVSGKIFHVTPAGTGELLLDTQTSNVMDLAQAPDGTIYAATESRALLMRVEPNSRGYALYHSSLDEVHALTFDAGGNLYAGALGIGLGPPMAVPASRRPREELQPSQNQEIDQPEAGVQIMPPEAVSGYQPPSRPERRPLGRRSEIYLLSPPGIVRTVRNIENDLVYSMVAETGGSLLLGTASEGRLLLLDAERRLHEIAKLDEKQVLALERVKDGGVVLGTGAEGKIYRLGNSHPPEGHLAPEVHDAGLTATWGVLAWEGETPAGTSLEFQTRVGNTEIPDDTWTDWSAPSGAPEIAVNQPPGRFVQWRAVLRTKDVRVTPRLISVRLAYVQANFPPEIDHLEVVRPTPHAANGGDRAGRDYPSQGRGGQAQPNQRRNRNAMTEKGTMLRWAAGDPNNDTLIYDLHFRGVGESRWKLIEEDIEDPFYVWDTEAVPDGRYEIKLVVSDRPDNPPTEAMTAERVTLPFPVDNTAPIVSDFTWKPAAGGKSLVVSCRIADNLSPVYRAEYSIDAGDWTPLGAADRVFDSRTEAVTFEPAGLETGEHTVVVRAEDEAGNVGAGKTVIQVK